MPAALLLFSMTDYYYLRKTVLIPDDLYVISSESIYWYAHGVNLRAVIAWLMGVWPLLRSLSF